MILIVGALASISLLALAVLYYTLVIESFDVTFLRVSALRLLALIYGLFLTLVIINLIADFQTFGTLKPKG